MREVGLLQQAGVRVCRLLYVALLCSEFCPEDEGASMVSFNLGREVTEMTSQIRQSEAVGAVISKQAAVRGGVRGRGEESQNCSAKRAPGIGSSRPCI